MESDSGKRAKQSGMRSGRSSIRYPLLADAEMLELESGSRVGGTTSDISPGGCFVCARRTLDVGSRVRVTLEHRGKKVKMLAVVLGAKEQGEMSLEFMDIDRD